MSAYSTSVNGTFKCLAKLCVRREQGFKDCQSALKYNITPITPYSTKKHSFAVPTIPLKVSGKEEHIPVSADNEKVKVV